MSLKIQSDSEQQEILTRLIEDSLEKISDYIRNIDEIDNNEKEHRIIVWMLENLPSMAVYSNYDNTIRINVLDCEQTDSVYLSRYLKFAIYQRILEIYRKDNRNQRFSTIASTAFCQLGVKKEHPGTCFIKRGKFGKVGRKHMIFPLTGESIDILQKWLDDCFLSKLFVLYEKIYDYCVLITKFSWGREQRVESPKMPEWFNNEEEKRIEKIKNIKVKNRNDDCGIDSEMVMDYSIIVDDITKKLNEQSSNLEDMIEKKDVINEILPLLKRLDTPDSKTENGRIEGIICEALLCSDRKNSISDETERNIYTELKPALIRSWKVMQDFELEKYICRDNDDWNAEVEQTLVDYFAYFKPEEGDKKEEKLKAKQQEAIRVKENLIRYVAKNNWVGALDESQVEIMYSQLIRDFMKILLIPLFERKRVLNRNYQIILKGDSEELQEKK